MKKLLTLFIAFIALATVSIAQPGNPNCGYKPGDGSLGTWSLSASVTTVANGETVTITANYTGADTCPRPASITVSATTGSCVSASPLSITANIGGAGSTAVVIGTFTLTNTCGAASTKLFEITSLTQGHTAGSGVTVTVNP
jgi:hypothetical protein